MTELVRPLFDRIAVKESQAEQMRQSGLIVPADSARDGKPPQEGIVLAVGPGLDWWESQDIAMPVLVGDKILFPWSAGVYVEVNEERILILRVGEILAVIE